MKKTILIAIMLTAGLYATPSPCAYDINRANEYIDHFLVDNDKGYVKLALHAAIRASYSCEGEGKEIADEMIEVLKEKL